jgi:2-polyprenyl-3-methyl-5-hydroxy-6-metoxy-1,4-benzoquinol methylase
MKDIQFREQQYQDILTNLADGERTKLGLMSSSRWETDPKTLLFSLARYKFVAKMLRGQSRVLEIGCGDGFQSRIVRQEVESLTISDFDPSFIADFEGRQKNQAWTTRAMVHDFVESTLAEEFDAAYALDVLEHIEIRDEDQFLQNVCMSLSAFGTLIVGMPSIESQIYASKQSKIGHVNCKTGLDLRETLLRHFHTVFSFSMNDEVVHTGFEPMAHYLIAVGVSPRR